MARLVQSRRSIGGAAVPEGGAAKLTICLGEHHGGGTFAGSAELLEPGIDGITRLY